MTSGGSPWVSFALLGVASWSGLKFFSLFPVAQTAVTQSCPLGF